MRALLLASAAVLALTSTVLAQNSGNDHTRLRSNLTQMLQQSGYTDIKVAPSSFVVRAKDQEGNPVVMSISPDEFTEVTAIGGTSGSNTAAKSGNTSGSRTAADQDAYVTVPSSDELSSKLVGLDVYNNENKDIGTIKDIALDPNGRTAAYILSVGGFLGIGDHYVAINPAAVKVTYNGSEKKWHASMNATADQLKSAPEFKYSGRWSASKS